MTAAILAAMALAASADPCAQVEPAAERDPAAAAAYRKAGDIERAAGSRTTATLAYRSALALDPSDEAARSALEALCAEGTGATSGDPFRIGLARMDAGDPRGAIEPFRQARAASPEASAALLEGICHYQLAEDEEAEPLLREAEAAPALRDSARFYLGLIAMRHGDTGEAASLFDSTAANPGFGLIASDLALFARRNGRLVLSFLASSGWNSNLTLAPIGFARATASDGSFSLAPSVLYRPRGESGPYVRASGLYQQQAQVSAFTVGAVSGAAGWQLGRTDRALLVEYGYDYGVLGGSPYLSANRLLGSGWFTSGALTLTGTYFARFESYQSTTYAPFSGTVQRAEARAAWWLGPLTRLGVSYRFGVDGVKQPYLSWSEHGPHADLYAQLGRRFRLGLEATLSFRPYHAVDPGFGAQRSDTYLEGATLAEYELGNSWSAQLSLRARRAFSNIPAFENVAFAPNLAIAYVLGM